VTQPKRPLPDVPLIVEDLLTEAKRLADAGAAPEEIKQILDEVEQLRAGRG
jgi:fatty acid-binding protein DegV